MQTSTRSLGQQDGATQGGARNQPKIVGQVRGTDSNAADKSKAAREQTSFVTTQKGPKELGEELRNLVPSLDNTQLSFPPETYIREGHNPIKLPCPVSKLSSKLFSKKIFGKVPEILADFLHHRRTTRAHATPSITAAGLTADSAVRRSLQAAAGEPLVSSSFRKILEMEKSWEKKIYI